MKDVDQLQRFPICMEVRTKIPHPSTRLLGPEEVSTKAFIDQIPECCSNQKSAEDQAKAPDARVEPPPSGISLLGLRDPHPHEARISKSHRRGQASDQGAKASEEGEGDRDEEREPAKEEAEARPCGLGAPVAASDAGVANLEVVKHGHCVDREHGQGVEYHQKVDKAQEELRGVLHVGVGYCTQHPSARYLEIQQ